MSAKRKWNDLKKIIETKGSLFSHLEPRHVDENTAKTSSSMNESLTYKKSFITSLIGPSIYDGFYLSNPEILKTQAIESFRKEFQKGVGKNYLLLGNVGVGKTFAILCLMAELSPSRTHKRILASDFATLVHAHDAASLARLQRVQVLFLDELGSEPMMEGKLSNFQKSNFVSALEQLIDYRHLHNLKTFIASNHTAESFKVAYGDRICSRLSDKSMPSQRCVIYELEGKDLRKHVD